MWCFPLLVGTPPPPPHSGYRPLLDAAKSFATDTKTCCGGRGGDGCCMSAKKSGDGEAPRDTPDLRKFCRVTSTTVSKLASSFLKPYEGDAELIFPSYLQVRHTVQPLRLVGRNVTWFRPVNVEQLIAVRKAYPEVCCVTAGGVCCWNAAPCVRVCVVSVCEVTSAALFCIACHPMSCDVWRSPKSSAALRK